LKQATISRSISQKLRSKKFLETEDHIKTSIYVKKLGISDNKIEEVVRTMDPQIKSAVCLSIDHEQYIDLTQPNEIGKPHDQDD